MSHLTTSIEDAAACGVLVVSASSGCSRRSAAHAGIGRGAAGGVGIVKRMASRPNRPVA